MNWVEKLARGEKVSEDLGFANLDTHRPLRNGFGEVVFGESKTVEEVVSIVTALGRNGAPVLVTRLQPEKLRVCAERLAEGVAEGSTEVSERPRIHERAGTLIANPPAFKPRKEFPSEPFVAIVSAGTSDLPVACEAMETCVAMGIALEMFTDVGVAGLHRLLARIEDIREASAVVVCAGMEGALPSVLGGLVSAPVFAVPTSVGYGASFGGVAALLGMLNSCAAGVSVCNIDNGFGAAMSACRVIRAFESSKRENRGRINEPEDFIP